MQANLRGTRSVMPLAVGLTILLGVGALVGLASPSQAAAAVRIGSDLSRDPFVSIEECPCTVYQDTHPSAQLTSPIDGVVVRYRIRKSSEGIEWGDVKLRILRSMDGGNTFQAVGTSPAASTATVDTEIVDLPARLPIRAGDHIGLDAASLYQVAELPGAAVSAFNPPLADSGPAASPNGGSGSSELPFNADIEPDCDGDGFGDETQDGDVSSCAPPPPPASPGPVAPPSIVISNAKVKEGDRGTKAMSFLVRLSAASAQPVTVQFKTRKGTAKPRSDFVARSGMLTFAPGQTVLKLLVKIKGDRRDERNEKFRVLLAGAAGATIADGTGIGTIRDND